MLVIRTTLINSLKNNCSKSCNWAPSSCFSTFTAPLFIRVTPLLMAEPMKKRKKADPAHEKLRNERKRKRLWRDVKRLMRNQNQLKPIDELEVPYQLVDEPKKYAREKVELSDDEFFERDELQRAWCIYRSKRHSQDFQMIERIDTAQEKALRELEKESPFLYAEAVKVEDSFLPFSFNGVTETPPIKDFDSPDGDYTDCTRKWNPFILPEMDKRLKKERVAARKAELEKAKAKNDEK